MREGTCHICRRSVSDPTSDICDPCVKQRRVERRPKLAGHLRAMNLDLGTALLDEAADALDALHNEIADANKSHFDALNDVSIARRRASDAEVETKKAREKVAQLEFRLRTRERETAQVIAQWEKALTDERRSVMQAIDRYLAIRVSLGHAIEVKDYEDQARLGDELAEATQRLAQIAERRREALTA